MPKRKRHSGEFKFKVALEAAKGTKKLSELAQEYQLHPSQISQLSPPKVVACNDAPGRCDPTGLTKTSNPGRRALSSLESN
jgi:hypothetical protein